MESPMADDDSLDIGSPLGRILSHYSPASSAERELWRPRITAWPGASDRDLVRWHGALIASAWLEQNTGHTPIGYRLTQAGRRILRRASQCSHS
jgi:hypothetical protein